MPPVFDAAALVEAIEGPRLSVPFSLIHNLGGDFQAAAFLAQAAYFSALKRKDGGWFDLQQTGAADPAAANLFARAGSWHALLGLSVDYQKIIREKLKKLGLLEEERRGVPARLHYHVDSDAYLTFLAGKPINTPDSEKCPNLIRKKRVTSCPEIPILDSEKSGNYSKEFTKEFHKLNPAATAAGDFFEPGFLYAVKKQNQDDEAVIETIKKCSKEEIVLAQQRLGPRKGCFPSYLLRELTRFAVSLQPARSGKQIGHKLTEGMWSGFDEKNYREGVNLDGSF